jgi:hypothetical protein
MQNRKKIIWSQQQICDTTFDHELCKYITKDVYIYVATSGKDSLILESFSRWHKSQKKGAKSQT